VHNENETLLCSHVLTRRRTVFSKRVNVSLALHNPISLPVEIVAANLTLFLCANQTSNVTCSNYSAQPMGIFYEGDLSADPIIIPASVSITTGKYAATALAGFSQILPMLHNEKIYDVALASASGTLLARVGTAASRLAMTISWQSSGIPLFLNWEDFIKQPHAIQF
jgi:hypothetical protein